MKKDEYQVSVLGSFYTYLFTAIGFIGVVCSVYLTQV